eukprot:NODE_169_length_2135_cov_248.175935_g133_i0.p1 GENE.NODE_169_length_2135_cov_248.175935_g133_i0~~NODE_169_length_2135_cov_248.175935_g133_i0.p1  ORF type:complete len:573 (+),score=124.86 NODE_169_length_2135_cov_248.175935_g133_i0:69-1721(+)
MRGIGVHHSGLAYSYRHVVEIMFRAKHIKAVLSTETLALGIHMPCRTVIFAGDHFSLNPLQFRQMSGRAGRRGFDLLGHVIFFGISEAKITRLMTSEIQSLQGHWPLTPAVVHRMLMLHTHPAIADKPKVQKRVAHQTASLWMSPLFTVASGARWNAEVGRQKTIHQIRLYFSTVVDTLMQMGLMHPSGEPRLFADVCSKLYNFDPANFIFLSLFKDGYLTDLTEDYQPVTTHEQFMESSEFVKRRLDMTERCMERLMLLLCHVVCRREIHRSVLLDKSLQFEQVHQVVLPPTDDIFQCALEDVQRRVLACFTAHAINVARDIQTECNGQSLPLSNIEFSVTASEDVADDSLVSHLHKTAIAFEARSPFVALAGRGDEFETQAELVQCLRDGIFVDNDMMPAPELRDTTLAGNGALLLNACVFDYHHSTSQSDVHKFNGLNYKESFEELDRFKRFMVRVARIFMFLDKKTFMPAPPVGEGGDDPEVTAVDVQMARSRLSRGWEDLTNRYLQEYSHANSKVLSLDDQKKKTTTAKKPKRPPLIKRGRFIRR